MTTTATQTTVQARRVLLVLALIALPAGSGLASGKAQSDLPRFGEELHVIGEIPFLEPVELGQPVTIRFGIGELEIETIAANELSADLEVRCQDSLSEALCEKYKDRLRLEPRRGKDGFEVRLVGLSKWKMRKLDLEGRVSVPRWSPLTVRVGVGEVDIRSDFESLSVVMGIGDLTVRVPQETVGTVDVGTKIGDASLWRSDGLLEGRRRMLIGSRVSWLEGTGTAKISVGLRIGDAKVVLE